MYRRGRSTQHRFLVAYRFDRPEDVRGAGHDAASRLGLTVSKRVGGAVERNRLKRQLRAALESSTALDAGADYVLIARTGLPDAVERSGFEWLQQLVDELLGKLAAP